MDILFLLVPLSVLLALGVMGVLAWAVWSGQFEELDCEGDRILGTVSDKHREAPELLHTNDTSLIYVKTSDSVVHQNTNNR